MDFQLSDEQSSLYERIARFGADVLSPGARERDARSELSRDLWRACAAEALLGLPIDTAYGGAGLDAGSTAITLEAFGFGCEDGGLVFSACAHLLAVSVPIWKHGTEAQKRRWLPGLSDGTLIGVNAMTEASVGSGPFAMSTVAVPDGDGFRLRGHKLMATNAPIADVVLVYALTDTARGAHGGLTAFTLETTTAGLTRSPATAKMGLRTAQMGELVFDDVWVSADQAIGGVGGGATVFRQSMEWERTFIAATHVGTMSRLLARVIAWAKQRKADGRPIGKHQSVSNRIVDMKVRLDAARLLVRAGACLLDDSREVAIASSGVKLFVSEAVCRKNKAPWGVRFEPPS